LFVFWHILKVSVLSLSLPLSPTSRQNQLKDQAQQALVSPAQLLEEAECLTVPKYKRDLVQKLKILRQELSQQQPQAGHCRIEVSREEIFEVRTERSERGHAVVSSDARDRVEITKMHKEMVERRGNYLIFAPMLNHLPSRSPDLRAHGTRVSGLRTCRATCSYLFTCPRNVKTFLQGFVSSAPRVWLGEGFLSLSLTHTHIVTCDVSAQNPKQTKYIFSTEQQHLQQTA